MKVPRYPVVVVLLLIILSVTSGKRWIDYFLMSNETGADVMVGSAMMPVFLLPATAVLSVIAFYRLPDMGSERISLFYWSRVSVVRQVLWSVFYGVIIIISFGWTIGWAELCVEFLRGGDDALAMKSGFYLIGSLGSNYGWMCLRAWTCYPRRKFVEEDSVVNSSPDSEAAGKLSGQDLGEMEEVK